MLKIYVTSTQGHKLGGSERVLNPPRNFKYCLKISPKIIVELQKVSDKIVINRVHKDYSRNQCSDHGK